MTIPTQALHRYRERHLMIRTVIVTVAVIVALGIVAFIPKSMFDTSPKAYAQVADAPTTNTITLSVSRVVTLSGEVGRYQERVAKLKEELKTAELRLDVAMNMLSDYLGSTTSQNGKTGE